MPHMQRFFLAATHREDQPLPNLVSEIRAIEKLLEPLQRKGQVQVLSNRAANQTDLFTAFYQTEQPIVLFHYAGHATQDALYLNTKSNVQGVAALLGTQRYEAEEWNPLKLVFLNGCATAPQVSSLQAAGVSAVIATSRSIEDTLASQFAIRFYESWLQEGQTLTRAFEIAAAWLKCLDTPPELIRTQRSVALRAEKDQPFSWGLFFHPACNQAEIENWQINPTPRLPKILLASIKSRPSVGLREVIGDFIRQDSEAKEQVRRFRKDPIVVLIERLPWTIGTHLRRLFAVEASQTMLLPGRERLKELIVAYTELSRFLSHLGLSMLWDTRRKQLHLDPKRRFPDLPFPIIPDQESQRATDFIFRLKWIVKTLDQMEDYLVDPIDLLPKLKHFLRLLGAEGSLSTAYLRMEGWKQALDSDQLDDLIASRTQDAREGLEGLVLEAEAIYAQFLKAALFLTNYKLHTLRSISVEKFHNLSGERPYTHYTISLHAAFSELQNTLTERATATDNYCLLLTLRGQPDQDVLARALNLSPFYVDRSAYIGNSTRDYPAIFGIQYQEGAVNEARFVYYNIDTDVNHQYAFQQDQQLVVDRNGAILPDHLDVEAEDLERFERIFGQFQQLEMDLQATKLESE